MTDFFIWIDENFLISYLIFVSLILPIIQKIDSKSKRYYLGKNKKIGFTTPAVFFIIIPVVVLIKLTLFN